MGLLDFFNFFRKRARDVGSAPDDQAPAHGWDAITNAFERLYPGQTNPAHRAPLVYRMHDLSEDAPAFDGISAYEASEYWHFVTFGLTELYDKQNQGDDTSGFGYEFTLRLPKVSDTPPPWAFDFLEAIGKQVWRGATFAKGHTIKTGPLDGRPDTRQTAVLVVRDPSFPHPLDSPNGRFEFLLLLGVQDEVRQRVLRAYERGDGGANWEASTLAELRDQDPNLVTPIRTVGEWGEGKGPG